jgi:[acyl-carrier-protein] S-malonyltransferase
VSRVAFLFPGQGAQAIGMGQSLAASLPAAADLMSRASEILGYDLAKLCYEGPAEELNSTVHCQPALYVTSMMALEQCKQDQPELVESVEATAGLSLGEYTALAFAGAISFEDGLRLVQRRGEAMQAAADAASSSMVSILGLDKNQIEDLCDQARGTDVLQVANLLCPGNIVVSGSEDACERITPLAEAAGAMKVIPLAVAGAFHTPIMQSAVDKLTAALAQVEIHKPRIPVISNVDVQPHSDPETTRQTLAQQVVSPVRWEDTMRSMLDQGFEQFYELGSGKVLRGLLRRINRKTKCDNFAA